MIQKIGSITHAILRHEDLVLDWFLPDASQIARHTDAEKIRLFGQDLLANGQLHAVSATEDRRMIAGHGRLLAARSAGLKTLRTNIFPASLTETQFKLIRAAENLHRTDLTGFEKWLIASELLAANPAWGQKGLVEQMHLSEGSISKILSPSKCTPAWQEALKAGKVAIVDCSEASRLPLEQQDGLLALRLGPSGKSAFDQAAKKLRAPKAATTVQQTKVSIAVAAGTRIVISGAAMDLEGVITTLAAALSSAKAAQKDRLDVRTFEKVAKDRAAAGA
jgi:ParB-like chromosome segregation protein Spo0J